MRRIRVNINSEVFEIFFVFEQLRPVSPILITQASITSERIPRTEIAADEPCVFRIHLPFIGETQICLFSARAQMRCVSFVLTTILQKPETVQHLSAREKSAVLEKH